MAKIKPPGKVKPLPRPGKYAERVKKYKSPDRIDYERTIAGRGDLHALDSNNFVMKKMKKKQRLFQQKPIMRSWEDRNRDNIGTKLNP